MGKMHLFIVNDVVLTSWALQIFASLYKIK
jgi:hypothetical protein